MAKDENLTLDLSKNTVIVDEILSLAHLGLWQWDFATNKVAWSKGMYRIFGLDSETFDGNVETAIEKAIHPEDRQKVREANLIVLTERRPWPLDYRILWPDGSVHVVRTDGKMVLDESGQPVGIMGFCQDITDQVSFEQALKASEERLRHVLESQTEIISRWLPDGTITYVNEAFCRFFRVKCEDIIGRVGFDNSMLSAEEKLRQQAHIRNLYTLTPQNPLAPKLVLQSVFPDGRTCWVEWQDQAIFDQAGKLIEFQSVGRDVTQLKQVEQTLRQSQANLSALIENTDASIWSIDRHYRLMVGNSVFHNDIKQSLGRDFMLGESVLPDDLPAGMKEEWQGYYDRALNGETFRLELRRRFSPEPRWVEYRFSPIRTTNGEIVGVTVLGTDITERRRFEDELQRSNAELEAFAYMASHDLQEPLRKISSFADLLRRRYRGQIDEKADKWIDTIVDGAQRMQRLILDLLDYSRVGHMEEQLTAVDLETAFRAALVDLRAAIRESGAVITHDPLPTLRVNAVQMRRLFQNLLGNAIKFRRANETLRVHVSATERENDWLFAVSDNGIGIEAQYLERIFMIFQRLHARSEYPGTGIGLAMCKKIVVNYGGKIWVESQLGVGSTFFFTLPKN